MVERAPTNHHDVDVHRAWQFSTSFRQFPPVAGLVCTEDENPSPLRQNLRNALTFLPFFGFLEALSEEFD